jgi:serine/threonine protein kinase
VPVAGKQTETPLIEPGQDSGRKPRILVPGRNNLLKPGTVLQNRYRILDIRGVGGMSTVYKSRDLRFTSVDRLCAVKEMFNSAEDAKLRQLRLANFQREASLLATLTHSAIPRIFDYFEQQGTIYLVLELIHGDDLETLLSQRGSPFDQMQLIDWALALCSVVAYLHNQKPEPIIFRDLKPSNIMIRAEDQSLMLVDFGIARTFAPQQKGTMIGTEGYAPPEQYKGIADARGDIYALGATLHHLATGSDPRSETPFTFGQRPPRKLNPSLAPALEELILRCVAYSPNERPQSADDVRHILEGIKYRLIADSESPPHQLDVAPTPISPKAVEATPANVRERSAGSNMLPAEADEAIDPNATVPIPAVGSNVAADSALRLDWSLKTGDEIRGSASGASGAIYIGSYDGQLYALDESDGSVRWRFRTQQGIVSRPAPFAEMVVFGSEDKSIYAVSRSSGRVIWSFRTDAPVRSSPLVDERACYVGSDDGYLYRIDRGRGLVTWRYKTFGPVRSSPASSGQHVLIGSDDGYLYTVHKESGSLVWRYQIGAPVMSSPLVHDQVVVVGASDGAIRGFGLGDGKVAWTVQTNKPVIASPSAWGKTIYVGSADGQMYAIDALSGKLVWKRQVCRQITSSAVVTERDILVGGNDAVFYCLDRETGGIAWTFGAAGPITSRPLLTDDHIIFGSVDCHVYALNRELAGK